MVALICEKINITHKFLISRQHFLTSLFSFLWFVITHGIHGVAVRDRVSVEYYEEEKLAALFKRDHF